MMSADRPYQRLLAVLVSFAIVFHSCCGYKEVTKSESSVGKAQTVYLCYNKNYYQLHNLVDADDYYLADATPIGKVVPQSKALIIYTYTSAISIQAENEGLLSLSIDKSQIYKYSKMVRNGDKAITIIGITIVALAILTAIIINDLNNMTLPPI